MTKKGSPKWKNNEDSQKRLPEKRQTKTWMVQGQRYGFWRVRMSLKEGRCHFGSSAMRRSCRKPQSRRSWRAAGFGAAGVANAAGFVTAGIASALHKSYEMVADSMFARFIRSVQKPPRSGATTPFTA